MRGKSRGSVRESGDSVDRLEGCLGARACMFGELGARGRAGRHARHMGGALERASVRAGVSGARACVRMGVWRTGMRLRGRRRVYCSPESTSFTRNHLNDLK
ncbi:hypothetical protein CRG98_028331 [Punica granatum]|uniref:Uncharacterized protein n=1 Tax=Punica granatum TaxID=22663 RepID=A0A2I0J4V8_PUNGR|nr:hypothetical protein CRG98_028331 [Punica granatum]